MKDFSIKNGILLYNNREVETDGNGLQGAKIALIFPLDYCLLVCDEDAADEAINDYINVNNVDTFDVKKINLNF